MNKKNLPRRDIEIQIFGDLICPWCYLGLNFLKEAISNRNQYEIKVFWRSFLLNREIPTTGLNRKIYLNNKHGGEWDLIDKKLTEYANYYNIHFKFDKIKYIPNTESLHELIFTVQKKDGGIVIELLLNIMRDYFENGLDIRNKNYLKKTSSRYLNLNNKKIIHNQQKLISSKSKEYDFINSIPVFIFNNKWTITGAQSSKSFENVIDLASKD
jgi:predicted DsbA family dithiol-disulfide isomerase